MPHLRLEYSQNLPIQKNQLKALFAKLHAVLVDQADATLARCQGRALCCEDFFVGDGDKTKAFVTYKSFCYRDAPNCNYKRQEMNS